MALDTRNIFGIDTSYDEPSIFQRTASFFNPNDETFTSMQSTLTTEIFKENVAPRTPQQNIRVKLKGKTYTIKQRISTKDEFSSPLLQVRSPPPYSKVPHPESKRVIHSDNAKPSFRNRTSFDSQSSSQVYSTLVDSLEMKNFIQYPNDSRGFEPLKDSTKSSNVFIIKSKGSPLQNHQKISNVRVVNPNSTLELLSSSRISQSEKLPDSNLNSNLKISGFDSPVRTLVIPKSPSGRALIENVRPVTIASPNGRIVYHGKSYSTQFSLKKPAFIKNPSTTNPNVSNQNISNTNISMSSPLKFSPPEPSESQKNFNSPIRTKFPILQPSPFRRFSEAEASYPLEPPRITSANKLNKPAVASQDVFIDTIKLRGFLSPKARQVSLVMNDQFRTPKSNLTKNFNNLDNLSATSSRRNSKFKAQEAVVNKIFNSNSHKRLISPEPKS